MNMTVWNPFKEMEDLLDRYGQSTRQLAEPGNNFSVPDWSPSVDISEDADNYTIRAEVPGLSKDDIDVSFDNGVLSIKGEKIQQKTEDTDKVLRTECSYGVFTRSFTLPEGIKEDEINASYKDGVLALTIPKAEEKKARSISVDIH